MFAALMMSSAPLAFVRSTLTSNSWVLRVVPFAVITNPRRNQPEAGSFEKCTLIVFAVPPMLKSRVCSGVRGRSSESRESNLISTFESPSSKREILAAPAI